jgi:hypothetical protein
LGVFIYSLPSPMTLEINSIVSSYLGDIDYFVLKDLFNKWVGEIIR